MARKRRLQSKTAVVRPDVWKDDILAECSIETRLLFMFLWCLADHDGYLPDEPDEIATFAMFRGVPSIEDCLQELIAIQYLERRFEDDNSWLVVVDYEYWQGRPRRDPSYWLILRDRVFRRDGYTCTYCGASPKQLHCDHVIPRSRGGSDEMSNLVTACQPCNQSKHARTPEEWRNARDIRERIRNDRFNEQIDVLGET